MKVPLKVALLIAAFVSLSASQARADAVLQKGGAALFPTRVEVSVTVVAQVETTDVRLVFSDLAAAGDYVLTVPGPADSYPLGVDLDQGGGYQPLPMQAKAPPPGAGGSPGAPAKLTAWQGHNALVANLAGLKPGPLSVRVHFQRLLRRYKGAVSFKVHVGRCPMRKAADKGPAVTVHVTCKTFGPLNVFSAMGAGVTTSRPTSNSGTVKITLASLASAATADIAYTEDAQGIQANFLTHRTPGADPMGGKDGYFLLIINADDIKAERTAPRRLSLVIDRSGSMAGDKIIQARKAALAMVDHLRDEDDFNIHDFDSSVSSFQAKAVRATATNIASAKAHINNIMAGGATNLDQGIKAGLTNGLSGTEGPVPRFDAMVLLSDGQPTAGVTSTAQILKNAVTYNKLASRIFSFAVGTGADRQLMEALARGSRGRAFVLNNAQANTALALKVKQLFQDIYAVRVTDIALKLQGLGASGVVPRRPRDLFNGGQMIITGRYKNPGQAVAKITGDVNGVAYNKSVLVTAPAKDPYNAFIKYVWATEKVGQLLADMLGSGNSQSLKDEIKKLGLAYRIQTPFTSFYNPPSGGSSGGGNPGGGNYNPGSSGYPGYGGSSGGGFEGGCSCSLGASPSNSPLKGMALMLAFFGLALAWLRLRKGR